MPRGFWVVVAVALLSIAGVSPPQRAEAAPPPGDGCTVTVSASYVKDPDSSYFGIDYTGSFTCEPGATPKNRTMIVRLESWDEQSHDVQGGDYRSFAQCDLTSPLTADDQIKLPEGDMVRVVIVGILKTRCTDNVIRQGDLVFRAYSQWIYLPGNQRLA